MNEMQVEPSNPGYALTPDQQAALDDLGAGSTCRQALRWLVVEIDGELQPQRLQAALDRVLAEQPMLLSQVGKVAGFHGWRQWTAAATSFPLRVQAGPQASDQVQLQIDAWAAEAFVPGTQANLQSALYCLAKDRWQWVVAMARHVADAASLALLVRLTRDAYASGQPSADAEGGEFGQYLEWRSEVVLDEDAGTARRYWQQHLQGQDVQLATPWLAERHGQATQTLADSSRTWVIEAPLRDALSALAQRLGRPVTLLLQAAWWALLARRNGRSELLVGVRHDSRADYDYFADALGAFEKTLPLALAFPASGSFVQWLDQLDAQLTEHRAWQEYWTADLAPDAARPAYGFSARQVAGTQVALGTRWQCGSPVGQPGESFELLLQACMDGQAAQHVALHYCAARYAPAAIDALLEQFAVLLKAAIDDPETLLTQLSMLSPAQQQRALALNPPSQALASGHYLPQHIADLALRNPQAMALTDDQQALTYGEMQHQIDRVALALLGHGVEAGATVALALPRSADLVIAMLACWRLGAAYLPIDVQWPAARQAMMLELADARVLVSAGQPEVPAVCRVLELAELKRGVAGPAQLPALATRGDDTAYVLFTSGSTGVPKGVLIEHRQLLNYTVQASQALSLQQCRNVAFSSTVAADLGNTALFGALYNGATLHVASDPQMQDAVAFADYLRVHAIDCLKIVPSHLAALLEVEQACVPQTVILGGEPIAPALIQRLARLRPDCRAFNHYGPTETTVGVMVHPLDLNGDSDDCAALSQVLGNNQVYVLDSERRLAPVGVLGELYLGGAQLCRGYLQAQADEQAFVPSPFDPAQRLYRSGDLARYRADGAIQLHGRRDQQVKVRGFRIELAEIEAQLLALPEVSEALVLAADATEAGLQAFIVARPGAAAQLPEQARSALSVRLPSVMVPARIQLIDGLPRLANGKVDRQALQRLAQAPADEQGVAPRDALEELLAKRMGQLLGTQRLGIDRDFFAAGGHSLLVIKLVAGIRKLLQCEVHPGLVFDHPSVASLAQALRNLESSPGQLEKLAQLRLRLDSMSPEEKARLAEQARQQQNEQAVQSG